MYYIVSNIQYPCRIYEKRFYPAGMDAGFIHSK